MLDGAVHTHFIVKLKTQRDILYENSNVRILDRLQCTHLGISTDKVDNNNHNNIISE